MKYLVTGGCGFIGSRLVSDICKRHEVIVLDNLSTGDRRSIPNSVRLVEDDIRNIDFKEDVDVVVHLAANAGVVQSIEDPINDCLVNVVGSVRVLEWARKKAKKVVLASSNAPLGSQEPPAQESKLPQPLSPYAASKMSMEAYARIYHECYGLNTTTLRFSNVYGPGSVHKGSVVALMIKKAMDRELLTVYGDGQQTRDFIYVDDLASAIQKAAVHPDGGLTFQVGTGVETSLNELIKLLEKELHGTLYYKYDEPRIGDIRSSYSDITRAKTVLGWKPEYTLRDGVKHTVEWFSENYRRKQ